MSIWPHCSWRPIFSSFLLRQTISQLLQDHKDIIPGALRGAKLWSFVTFGDIFRTIEIHNVEILTNAMFFEHMSFPKPNAMSHVGPLT